MHDRLTFIDLETTGLSDTNDRIIEFGAVRIEMESGREVDRFSRLCDPGRDVPLVITRLTGIRNRDVEAADPLDEVLADFLDFLGDDTCVAYNAPFDQRFLRAATNGTFDNSLLDCLQLARIVLPAARSHRLEALTRHYEIAEDTAHRAADDAELTALVWRRLLADLYALPLAVLSEMSFMLANTTHPLKKLIDAAESAAAAAGFGQDTVKFKDLPADFRELVTYRPPEPDPEAPRPEPEDPERSVEVLSAGGAISRILDDFEKRPQQIEMVRAVAKALADGRHLIAEAGTGVGKSLAYLVPAVLHAVKTGEKVVISTHTKNLQSQLFYKDLPQVAEALGVEFKAALIKGRTNYLCLRKLLYHIRESARELSPEERIAMLPVLTWAATTRTGDLDENTALGTLAPPGLRERLVTTSEECLGKASPAYHQCFPRMNRGRALQADIIIANHALVFSELGQESAVLPPHSILILDEAHNIEDVATDHLAVRVNRYRFYRILNRLFRRARSGPGGTGLLASVHHQLSRAPSGKKKGIKPETLETARQKTSEAIDRVEPVAAAIEDFFASLVPLADGGNRSDDRVRLRADKIQPEIARPIKQAKQELIARCAALAQAIESLLEALRDRKGQAQGLSYVREFLKELEAQVQYLRDVLTDLAFILKLGDDAFVYWLEVKDAERQQVELAAAPLDISELLYDQIYSQKRTVILTSATLTVEGRFDFLKQRLGLDRIEPGGLAELAVGTPFDFDRQCLLIVPSFLPEPQAHDFTEQAAELMSEVFIETQGRGLGLFTSYEMLRRVYETMRPRLEAANIPVFAQGQDGTREALLEQFSRDVASVLLGTTSFWEGVDVKGEALSALIVAKLPFGVPTDPIIKGRCDLMEAAGQNAFMEYSLPVAVLRLRQGFGRLIRAKTDRGVVVVADKRVLTRRYGGAFLRSLPTRHKVARNLKELRQMVRSFMNGSGLEP